MTRPVSSARSARVFVPPASIPRTCLVTGIFSIIFSDFSGDNPNSDESRVEYGRTGMIRGLRGATTVSRNDAGEIAERTRELIQQLEDANGVRPQDIASAIFTVTSDMTPSSPPWPPEACPEWKDVPLLCVNEIPVPRSLSRCIRILIHWNTDRRQEDIRLVYLRGARRLRPEWAARVPGDEEEETVRAAPSEPPR